MWSGHKYWLGLQQTQTEGHENQGCDQALKAYFLHTHLMPILLVTIPLLLLF